MIYDNVIEFTETSLPMQGEWIEILCQLPKAAAIASLPMQGEWIEIAGIIHRRHTPWVSPHAGRVD